MEEQKVKTDTLNMWLMANQKFFPSEKIPYLKKRLAELSEEKFNFLYAIDLKDPTTILLISIFLGNLGIDRFMIGDTGMGVLKLLTFGLCGILLFYDWFTIMDKTKELNFTKLLTII